MQFISTVHLSNANLSERFRLNASDNSRNSYAGNSEGDFELYIVHLSFPTRVSIRQNTYETFTPLKFSQVESLREPYLESFDAFPRSMPMKFA